MNNDVLSQDRLLNEVEAAHYLGLRPRTLQNWRWTGNGPRFIRISARAIRYRRNDLEEFVSNQEVGGEK
jgi:predicted DNA-binding transcriptional regulator AlpA